MPSTTTLPVRACAVVALLAACLVPSTHAAEPVAPPERESPVRLGLYSGVSLPIAQEDAAAGFLYGLNGRLRLSRRLAASASVEVVRHRDGHATAAGTSIAIEAPGVRSLLLGADVTLLETGGLSLYATTGLGWTRLDTVRDDTETNLTTTLGCGALASLGEVPLWVELSPRLVVVTTGDASRKHVTLRAGITYAVD